MRYIGLLVSFNNFFNKYIIFKSFNKKIIWDRFTYIIFKNIRPWKSIIRQIKTNYEAQFSISSMFNDEIKKNQLKKTT
jgi:hypothetical protein